MARTTNPLTNTEVKQAKAKAKEYNLADGGGLLLRVKPNGSKLWVFNYSRPHTKVRANLGLGAFLDVSLADARKWRDSYRKLLAQNIDPKHHREDQRRQQEEINANTLAYVIGLWFDVKQTKITASYAQDIIRSLSNHIIPSLGEWPIHQISAPLVIDALKPLAASGKLEAVKRVSQRLNEVMVYAVNTGIIQHNPLTGIRDAFSTPKVTNNPTFRPDEISELTQALSKANIRNVTRHIIAWQLHTMTRPSEAAGARWDEINRVKGVWIIPPERMKKRREHVIPLSPQALVLLDSIAPISGRSVYIFPSDINPRKSANSSTANVALKRMGFKGRLTAHGMRALASTTLNEQGFDSDIIEAALAHVDKNAVRGAYNRAQYIQRRRAMMIWWSEHIELAATGNINLTSKKSLSLVRVAG